MKGLILVTGSDSMVGSRFIELSPRKNFLHLPTQVELDITSPDMIKELLARYNFSAIINFAAYTDVSQAEEERGNKAGTCWQVDVEGVKNLVDAINPVKTHFIQISTDMVFPGSAEEPGPYIESQTAETDSSKLTWYGYTKAEAERYITDALGQKASIVRITNPVRAKFEAKPDYARKLLKLFDEGKMYPLFTDQVISVTFIDELALVLDKIFVEHLTGIFHVSSPDTTTPLDFASYLIEKARGVSGGVQGITMEEFLKNGSSAARYPLKGGLNVYRTKEKLGIEFKPWKRIIDELIVQGIAS